MSVNPAGGEILTWLGKGPNDLLELPAYRAGAIDFMELSGPERRLRP